MPVRRGNAPEIYSFALKKIEAEIADVTTDVLPDFGPHQVIPKPQPEQTKHNPDQAPYTAEAFKQSAEASRQIGHVAGMNHVADPANNQPS